MLSMFSSRMYFKKPGISISLGGRSWSSKVSAYGALPNPTRRFGMRALLCLSPVDASSLHCPPRPATVRAARVARRDGAAPVRDDGTTATRIAADLAPAAESLTAAADDACAGSG